MGWAIAAENENVTMILRDNSNNDTAFYITLAIETNFYQKQPINAMICVPMTFPASIEAINDNELTELTSQFQESLPANALKLKRHKSLN